jgi:hypothetical protein
VIGLCGFNIDFENIYRAFGFVSYEKQWKPDLSSLSKSIKDYSGSIEELDTILCKLLNSGELDISHIDNESLQLCFELGLNKVLKVVLESTQSEDRFKDGMDKDDPESIEFGNVSESYHMEGSVDERDHVPTSSSSQGNKQMACVERESTKLMLSRKDSKKKSHQSRFYTFEIPQLTQESNVDEEIVIQILESRHQDVSQYLNTANSETGDNLLHRFSRRGFKHSLIILMRDYEIEDLYFNENKAGDIPLMVAIENENLLKDRMEDESQNLHTLYSPYLDTNIVMEIWQNMVNSEHNVDINGILTHLNRNQKNIFHTCADNQTNDLLLAICNDPSIKPDAVDTAINQENADKQTPLDCCSDEKTVLSVMGIISNFNTNHKDGKGNNIIHIFGKKDFKLVIKTIFDMLSESEISKLLVETNQNGNNPLMSCVFKNSNATLNLLLCTLFTLHVNEQNYELVGSILHDQNTSGSTLLSLILHFQQGKALSKSLALQMEKNYHTVTDNKSMTMAKLTTCLRDNVEASVEVLHALEDVEKCYEENKFGMIMIFINLFITLFLVPFLVMGFDVSFDIVVVKYYYKEMTNGYNKTDSFDCTNLNGSSIIAVQKRTEELLLIPEKLNATPRFYYSIGFLIFPWMFYFIEFLHSRYYGNLVKKVISSHVL